MVETPGDRLTRIFAGNRVADGALRLRNAEALARLKRLVEGAPAARPGGVVAGTGGRRGGGGRTVP